MSTKSNLDEQTAILTNERATPSLVYRALLKSVHAGTLVPGAKLPNERDLARQLNTSRTAVRAALAMMDRQGLVRRRVGSGTYLTDDADRVFEKMDQTGAANHNAVPSFFEIVEGRLLFEPAMMHLVVSRAQPQDIEAMQVTLSQLLKAPTWRAFKESIYALHQRIFSATKNRFLIQIVESIIVDRRAVAFDGRDVDRPAPELVRQQTHADLGAIVSAIAKGEAKKAESLMADHLMRMMATVNIWQ